MTNPAALAMALLLGHEARITDEQWSEVKDMRFTYCDRCRKQIIGGVCGCTTPQATPPRCPACEAAARERDDLRARVEAECDAISRKAIDEDDDYYIIAQRFRALLAEKEAK